MRLCPLAAPSPPRIPVLFDRERVSGDVPKLAPRATPHVVTSARHPNYEVRDASGRTFRALAQRLRADLSGLLTFKNRVPPEPSAASTRVDADCDTVVPDSVLIIKSESPSEPWRLVVVRDDEAPAGFVNVHYYNRANKSSHPGKWAWRPAYVDPSDGVDVLTYCPARRYQPYHRTIPRHMVLFADVRLKSNGTISAADLQRVSASTLIPWTYAAPRSANARAVTVGDPVRQLRGFLQHR